MSGVRWLGRQRQGLSHGKATLYFHHAQSIIHISFNETKGAIGRTIEGRSTETSRRKRGTAVASKVGGGRDCDVVLGKRYMAIVRCVRAREGGRLPATKNNHVRKKSH